MADRYFEPPMPATPSTGPKQPLQGILILMHDSPHPLRVAGPAQRIPWARKHFSGSASTSCILLNSLISILSGFVLFLSQTSQSAVLGANVDPLGGMSPLISFLPIERMRSGGGGQPGR